MYTLCLKVQYYNWWSNIFSLELKKFNKIKASQGEFQKYSDTTVEMDRKKKGGKTLSWLIW